MAAQYVIMEQVEAKRRTEAYEASQRLERKLLHPLQLVHRFGLTRLQVFLCVSAIDGIPVDRLYRARYFPGRLCDDGADPADRATDHRAISGARLSRTSSRFKRLQCVVRRDHGHHPGDGADQSPGRDERFRRKGCRTGCTDARHLYRYPAILDRDDDLSRDPRGVPADIPDPAQHDAELTKRVRESKHLR
jgi:hypothetical protein